MHCFLVEVVGTDHPGLARTMAHMDFGPGKVSNVVGFGEQVQVVSAARYEKTKDCQQDLLDYPSAPALGPVDFRQAFVLSDTAYILASTFPLPFVEASLT